MPVSFFSPGTESEAKSKQKESRGCPLSVPFLLFWRKVYPHQDCNPKLKTKRDCKWFLVSSPLGHGLNWSCLCFWYNDYFVTDTLIIFVFSVLFSVTQFLQSLLNTRRRHLECILLSSRKKQRVCSSVHSPPLRNRRVITIPCSLLLCFLERCWLFEARN